jgi:hypothetical protein
MKKTSTILSLAVLGLSLVTAQAQFGPPGHGGSSGPQFGGAIGKLFGDNQAFSASLEFQTTVPSGEAITIPGRLSFDAGKSRFAMNMADIQGSKMPPDAAAHMKAMGLDQMVAIGRPDRNVSYLIYPGMQSYVENSLPGPASSTNSDFKTETTELGKETLDGHDCIKNKVVVTDQDGVKHESTVWNATDLKKFPVKIETNEQGRPVVMQFKDISLKPPAASEFDAPAGYTKYESIQAMMQTEMMKKMGNGAGMPPH